jgi:hypothetical protein
MLHIFSSYILGERSSNSRIVDFHFIFYPRLVPSQNLGATEEDERGKECVWYCGSCCGCGLKKVVL